MVSPSFSCERVPYRRVVDPRTGSDRRHAPQSFRRAAHPAHLPVYFAALVVFFALGRVVPFLFLPVKATLAFLFMVGNVWEAHHGWLRSPASSLWSVSVEEQFYLVIPTLFAFGGTRALLYAAPVIVAAAYAALLHFGLHGANPHLQVWANSFVQFQFFAAGSVCAILLHGKQWLVSRSARIALLVSGLLAWFLSVRFFGLEADLPTTATRLLGGYPLLLAGTLAIFLAVFNCTLRIPSWLRYLGKISYGLYVFHYFWLSVVFGPALRRFTYFHTRSLRGAAAALLATIATAAVSYTFFEKPILRIKDRFEFIRTRSI